MKFIEHFSSKNLSKKEIGDRGEDLAAKMLKKRGYKIIERNFAVHGVGELDIVARDGDCLCIVEVRLRSNPEFGTPAQTVSPEKRRRLVRTAQIYAESRKLGNHPLRFDIAEVFGDGRVELIKDAFWAEQTY